MRRAAKKDRNHREIADALRALGCVVVDVSGTPCGCDLFVFSRRREWVCIEIKDGELPPSARKLTASERALRETCLAVGAPHAIVGSIEDARKSMGLS